MENADIKIQANLHGIDTESDVSEKPQTQEKEPSVPMFGDPSQYEKMSEEERNSQTEKMMSRHKSWVAEKKA